MYIMNSYYNIGSNGLNLLGGNSTPLQNGLRVASSLNIPLSPLEALQQQLVHQSRIIIPDNIVEEIVCRFLLNLPEDQISDSIRLFFQVELAHWFFIDHYCSGEGVPPHLAALAHIPFAKFAQIVFKKTPFLQKYAHQVEDYCRKFREYKKNVPTYGAILMNQELTKVVLVQGFGNTWGFPKGKKNENEDPVVCAVREVFEETGYDCSKLIKRNQFIESRIGDNRVDVLYCVRGVDMNFEFCPQTLYEIKNIGWFNIQDLPEHKKDTNSALLDSGFSSGNFYNVYSYVKRLKAWVADKLEGRNEIKNFKASRVVQSPITPFTLNDTQSPISSPISKQYGQTNSHLAPGYNRPQKNGSSAKPKAVDSHSHKKKEFVYSYSSEGEGKNTSQEQKLDGKTLMGILGAKPKNPKRRLFVDDEETGQLQNSSFVSLSSTNGHNTQSGLNISKSSTEFSNNKSTRHNNNRASLVDNVHIPSWENFRFDWDPIVRAMKRL